MGRDLFIFWDFSVPRWLIRNPRVHRKDCTQLQKHNVIFKCAHKELTLRLCDVCVTVLWLDHGRGDNCGQLRLSSNQTCFPGDEILGPWFRPPHGRHLQSSRCQGGGQQLANSCGKHVFVSHYCSDKIMIAFNLRPQMKGWTNEWKNSWAFVHSSLTQVCNNVSPLPSPVWSCVCVCAQANIPIHPQISKLSLKCTVS